MEVRVSSTGGAPSNYYGKSGIYFSFINSDAVSIGSVQYIAATTQYPFEAYSDDPTIAAVQVDENINTHYRLTIDEILSHIDIDEAEINNVQIMLQTYSSTYPNPYVEAELWIDNIIVSYSPECVETTGIEYVLSGGPEPDAGIFVDDILSVFLNGDLITEFSQSGRCCPPADPVRFIANTGDTLRVVAQDANNCYSLETLYLQKVNGNCLTLLTEDIFGPNCDSEPPMQTFFDETFVLP
jgi:hypothetical protein